MKRFSIILPAYNVEQTLAHTLESILHQDFSDYELIIINDGSADRTLAIIQDYARRYPQITVLTQPNRGVSAARNLGLSRAKGEYILFCDADDVYFNESLRRIDAALREHPVDLLRYEFQTIDAWDNYLYINYKANLRAHSQGRVQNAADAIRYQIRGEYFLWTHAFRRSLLQESGVRFLEDCRYNEDMLFITQYLLHSRTHVYVPIVAYGYRKYPQAVTAQYRPAHFQDSLRVFQQLSHIHTPNRALNHSIHQTVEQLGRELYQRSLQFGTPEERQYIIRHCTHRPTTPEWKTFTLAGTTLWSFLHLTQKLRQHLA